MLAVGPLEVQALRWMACPRAGDQRVLEASGFQPTSWRPLGDIKAGR